MLQLTSVCGACQEDAKSQMHWNAKSQKASSNKQMQPVHTVQLTGLAQNLQSFAATTYPHPLASSQGTMHTLTISQIYVRRHGLALQFKIALNNSWSFHLGHLTYGSYTCSICSTLLHSTSSVPMVAFHWTKPGVYNLFTCATSCQYCWS